MSDNQNTRPVYPKSILDHRSMRVSVEAADAGKWATFSVDVNDVNEVVFKVWPQDSDDASRNRGPIEARFTAPWFGTICDLIRLAMKMSKEGKEWQDKVEYSDRPWVRGDGGRSVRAEKAMPMWALWVGSTADGRVWVSVQVYKRPNIQFFFGKDTFNNLYHKSGEPYADAEISRAFVSGWLARLEEIVPVLLRERYNHEKTLPKKREDGQGGGNQGGQRQGGGNNYGGQSGGNSGGGQSNQNQRSESTPAKSDSYSSSSTEVDDDDMPF
jgi:hypothetical protein